MAFNRELLIVGQAPSRVMSLGDEPLWGTQALVRLAGYAGIYPPEKLYDLADFVNVIEYYPGPSKVGSKWDAFPEDAAKEGAIRVRRLIRYMQYRRVITLGTAVTKVVWQKHHEWSRGSRFLLEIICLTWPLLLILVGLRFSGISLLIEKQERVFGGLYLRE